MFKVGILTWWKSTVKFADIISEHWRMVLPSGGEGKCTFHCCRGYMQSCWWWLSHKKLNCLWVNSIKPLKIFLKNHKEDKYWWQAIACYSAVTGTNQRQPRDNYKNLSHKGVTVAGITREKEPYFFSENVVPSVPEKRELMGEMSQFPTILVTRGYLLCKKWKSR